MYTYLQDFSHGTQHTHFRLFSGKPRLFEPKDLSKLHFEGIQRIGQIIVGTRGRPVVEGCSGQFRGIKALLPAAVLAFIDHGGCLGIVVQALLRKRGPDNVVLGSMFFGLATPTEASALGAVGTLVCCVIQKRFSWSLLQNASLETFKLTGIVMWIGFGATCFSTTFTSFGGADYVAELITGIHASRWFVFAVIVLILLVLGCFLDPTSIIMIAGPISFSVLLPLGFDPIWLGVVFVILLECGYLTPPFGFNIFYLKSIVPPEISTGDVISSMWPWVIMLLLGVVLLSFFPQIVLWLPNAMAR